MEPKGDGPKPGKTRGASRVEDTLAISTPHAHTGEQVPEETREKVLEYLAKGGGIHEAAKECRLNVRTVMAIRTREVKDNPKFAQAYYSTRTPARLLHLANQAMDRMEEEMQSLPAGVLPVVMGVALDKYLALSGQASQVVEHRHSVSLGAAADPFRQGAIEV